MVDRPNRDALSAALDIYRDSMRPFIVRCLDDAPGEGVVERISEALNERRRTRFRRDVSRGDSVESAIDINDFQHIVRRHWRDLGQYFADDRGALDRMGLIARAHNRALYPPVGDLDVEEVRVAVTDISDQLRRIGEAAEADRVQELWTQVVELIVAEGAESQAREPGSDAVAEPAGALAPLAGAVGNETQRSAQVLKRVHGERIWILRIAAAFGLEHVIVLVLSVATPIAISLADDIPLSAFAVAVMVLGAAAIVAVIAHRLQIERNTILALASVGALGLAIGLGVDPVMSLAFNDGSEDGAATASPTAAATAPPTAAAPAPPTAAPTASPTAAATSTRVAATTATATPTRVAATTATATASTEPAASPTPASYYEIASGSGVKVRKSCDNSQIDSLPKQGIKEGAVVELLKEGSGDCAGWKLVRETTGDPPRESWVLNKHLADPAAASALVPTRSLTATATLAPSGCSPSDTSGSIALYSGGGRQEGEVIEARIGDQLCNCTHVLSDGTWALTVSSDQCHGAPKRNIDVGFVVQETGLAATRKWMAGAGASEEDQDITFE